MVSKIFKILNGESTNIHGTAYLLGFFAFLAQLLALLRDRLLASSFGASKALDIYYAGFRVPDLIFVIATSFVSISVLVPILTQKQSDNTEFKNFIDSIFKVFSIFILLVSGAVFFLMPYIVPKFFPGFAAEDMKLLIAISRILLFSPILLGLSNFFAAIVQLSNRFFLYALGPILYNIGIIFGIVFLYPKYGLYGLVIGVCVGAFLHCAIQLPFILKEKYFPKIFTKIQFKDIWKVFLISLPRTVTLSTGSISILFLLALASVIGTGAISIFNFSFNLQTGPLSIIGVSYASAIFPVLSRLYMEKQKEMFLSKMIAVTKHIFFWSLPACALFIVLRAQIVRTVLGGGFFDWSDTRLTAATLAIFTLSMIPQSLILLYVRAFYSEGRTTKPLLINVVGMLVTIFAGYFFMYAYESFETFAYFIQSLFRIEDVPGSSVTMLALAYSFGITFNTFLHWLAFEREFRGYTRAVVKNMFNSFCSSVIIGLVAYKMLDVFDNVFNINTFMGIFLQGLCAGLVGIVAGVFILMILKSRELAEVLATLHKKIWKIDKTTAIVENT